EPTAEESLISAGGSVYVRAATRAWGGFCLKPRPRCFFGRFPLPYPQEFPDLGLGEPPCQRYRNEISPESSSAPLSFSPRFCHPGVRTQASTSRREVRHARAHFRCNLNARRSARHAQRGLL